MISFEFFMATNIYTKNDEFLDKNDFLLTWNKISHTIVENSGRSTKMMANIHLAGMEEDLYSGYDKEDMAPQLNTEDLGTLIGPSRILDS